GGRPGAAASPASVRVAGRPGRIGARRRGYGRPVVPTRTGPPTVTGRWSLLPDRDPDPTRRLHAVAQSLLDRHGIVTRGSVVAERVPGGFGALYPVLRAMEEAGQCRRGYFVEGLGAAQFALPGAVDRMRAIAAAQDAAGGPPRRDRGGGGAGGGGRGGRGGGGRGGGGGGGGGGGAGGGGVGGGGGPRGGGTRGGGARDAGRARGRRSPTPPGLGGIPGAAGVRGPPGVPGAAGVPGAPEPRVRPRR